MFTTIIFIIVLGILVLVHEFGHFYVAKKAGMKVEEFGFGFPPRIFGIKRGETIYSINWIPFGGFVKIYGENGENENDPRSFASKSAGSKAKVIVAGVIMNFLLAVIFLSFANTFGLRIGLIDDATIARDIKIQVIQVSSDSPAEAAGLKTFDEIIKIKKGNDAVSPMQVEEVQNFIKKYGGEEITMTIKRNGGEIDKPHVKRTMGQHMLVTPNWIEQKIKAKLAEPIIKEQIETAKRVYAEAKEVLATLHRRKDAASGNATTRDDSLNYKYMHTIE